MNRGGADATNIRAFITSEGGDFLLYDYVDTSNTILHTGEMSTLHFGIHNWAEVGSDILIISEINADHYSAVDQFYLHVIDSLESFETKDFSLFPWDLSQGDSEWVIDSVNAYDMRFCARSGPISRYHASILEVKLEIIRQGEISFYRKVSDISSPNNKLAFYIDSVLMGAWSGLYDWARQAYPVSAGEHTFTWKYNKVVSTIDDSLDCAWIDYIAFPECNPYGFAVEEVAEAGRILSIYPNPTRGISHFAIHISQYQYVTCKIYDLHGREVMLVLDEELPAGEHVVQVDMTGLKEGVYFVELRAKGIGHRVVGKVVLVR
jgi:hypothetical protein